MNSPPPCPNAQLNSTFLKPVNAYNNIKKNNVVYDLNGNKIGVCDDMFAIAHNGKDIGSVHLKSNRDERGIWIKGNVIPFKNGWKLV